MLAIPTIIAQAQEIVQPVPQPAPIPKIPSGHALYGVKLWWESAQEKLTFDNTKLLLLKQEHMQNRIDELKYDIIFKNSQHAESLLQKIQIRRLEIEDITNQIPDCIDRWIGQMGACKTGSRLITKEGTVEHLTSTSTEVLTNLLNDPTMPESARKGLQNVLNRTGMMKQIKANMVQGSFYVNPSTASMLPFSAAWLFEPTERKWYSIIIYSNKITITDVMVSIREYDLYPTPAQIEEIKQLVSKINKQGKITTKDKITLTKLWFTIQKKEVN